MNLNQLKKWMLSIISTKALIHKIVFEFVINVPLMKLFLLIHIPIFKEKNRFSEIEI